jgi:hypothetical protein
MFGCIIRKLKVFLLDNRFYKKSSESGTLQFSPPVVRRQRLLVSRFSRPDTQLTKSSHQFSQHLDFAPETPTIAKRE